MCHYNETKKFDLSPGAVDSPLRDILATPRKGYYTLTCGHTVI